MAKNTLSAILTCLVIFVNLVILNTLFVILSRRRSIHKFKAHLKFLWIFLLRLVPCNPLGRFVRKLKMTVVV